jgi:uncharacterized protein (TIGR02217 family)
MADFLEERLSRDILIGASFQDDYAVTVVNSDNWNEYRRMAHPFPARRFDVSFLMSKQAAYDELLAMWHRAHGQYAGFRVRCYDEWSSNGATGTPTYLDQPTIILSATTRQLVKRYGTNKTAGATGYPYRQIKKPVSGTVVAAKNGVALTGGQFTVDTTTGIVTVASAIITDTITCGFEFDFPVRFSGSMIVSQDYNAHRNIDGIELVEILNP